MQLSVMFNADYDHELNWNQWFTRQYGGEGELVCDVRMYCVVSFSRGMCHEARKTP